MPMTHDKAIFPPIPAASAGDHAICIVGMVRSGTSLTAQMLQKCEVFLGLQANLKLSRQTMNSDGFFEHRQLIGIHDRILRLFAPNGWDSCQPLPLNWLQLPAVLAIKQELR